MKCYDVLTSGAANIQQNKLRASLSILGIFIGVASVLCMMAIGDGSEKIIAADLERLGGANHIRFATRTAIYRRGRWHATIGRYTLADAYAIEAECPYVSGVLPLNYSTRVLATNHEGRETRHATLEGTTADYSFLMRWNLREGRFFSENDIEKATQTCV